jgi:hypothetical protein
MMTRRSLFGLVLLPVLPMPAPAKRSFLAPGHMSADPPLLVDSPTALNEACRKLMRADHVICWQTAQDRAWCGCNREERRNADCRCWQRIESNRPEMTAGAENGPGG